jgi:putative radical SAM enzyme (TIGR03279 family)
LSTQIQSVDRHSPAEHAGVRPGETLTHINGNRIIDVLDYKFYSYDPKLELTIKDEDGTERTVHLMKREGQDLGLNFETYLMDRARSCANNCIFCFVDQTPKGMRQSLYFKDDDARLSFLMGNYITLTNLSQREVQRIIDLRISPINVSVHATDRALRCQLLGNKNAGRGIDIMERFAENRITMNCQVVSCPGINDGAALDQTMNDLAAMYPSVNSVSIVPVGVTKHREGLYPLTPYTKEQAAAVLDQVEAFAAHCLETYGTRIFWCSDEFYLIAQRPLPEDEYFENYTQLENGVGMLTLLEVEFMGGLKTMDEYPDPGPFSIATGVSAAPFLQKLMEAAKEKYPTLQYNVYPIRNEFFGETIVVAGLVTGQDLIGQLRGKELGNRLLIPNNMLRAGENVFLDDVTLEQVSEELGVPVIPVEQDGFVLCDTVFGLAGEQPPSCPTEEQTEYYSYNPSH